MESNTALIVGIVPGELVSAVEVKGNGIEGAVIWHENKIIGIGDSIKATNVDSLSSNNDDDGESIVVDLIDMLSKQSCVGNAHDVRQE